MSHSLKNLVETLINPDKNWKVTLLYKWQDIIGGLHKKVQIEKIQDDILILGVFHSSWMQELYLLSPLLLKTINEKLEYPYIKQIRFKYISKKNTVIKKKMMKMEYKKDIQLNTKEEQILTKINDPILREALRAFRIRCYQES